MGELPGPLGLEPLRPSDPRHIGEYRIVGRLGAGGAGVAYLSEAPDGSWAVVKAIWPHLVDSDEHMTRLNRELIAMHSINSPRTVKVLASDVTAERPWFAMEYVPGLNLAEHVRTFGPLGSVSLMSFASELASGLQEIHNAGLVHRDLKPANVILTQDGPRIIDFGVAHLTDATAMTNTGTVIGTLGWMAPEQVAGRDVSYATDVHAWGLCVIHAATGLSPFAANSPTAVALRVINEIPVIPEDLPSPLLPLVSAAVSKEPRDRPSSAQLSVDSLRDRTKSTPSDDETTVKYEAVPTSSRRSRLLMPILIVMVLFALILTASVGAAMITISNNSIAADVSEAQETPQNVARLDLLASPPIATVGEPLTVVASVTPRIPGVGLELETRIDGGWEKIDTGETNSEGLIEWTVAGHSDSGIFRYRVAHFISEIRQIFSEHVQVQVRREATESVVVRWPNKPVNYCESQPVRVKVEPVEAGRSVVLEYSMGAGEWVAADSSRLNDKGQAQLKVPGCEIIAFESRPSTSWRVVAEQSNTLEVATSGSRVLQMMSLPIMCPAPETLNLYQVYEWAVEVVNPSRDCAAEVVISLGLVCEPSAFWLASEYLGNFSSEPINVEPGGVLTVDIRDLFSGACPSPPYSGMGRGSEYILGYITYSAPR